MNGDKKIKRIFQPSTRLYCIVLIVFAIATFFCGKWSRELAIIEACIVVLLLIYLVISNRNKTKKLLEYIESVSYDVDAATKDTLLNFPLPMVIFSLDENTIIYSNPAFTEITSQKDHMFEREIDDIIPGFTGKWLMEGKNEYPGLITIGDRKYRVYGSLAKSSRDDSTGSYLATTYWVDETEDARITEEYALSRPVFSIIMIDNYDEFLKGLSEKEKSAMLSMLDDRIGDWCSGSNGYLCKYDRDRYLFIFEHRHLQSLVDGKFSLLDAAREITSPKGIPATISIGIGMDGKTLVENYQYASLSIDMALSRGGDQAVIKNRFNFEFFGGKTSQQEKRTKVKSRVMANSLTELMRESSQIFVMGHKYADLDTVGAACGIVAAARKLGKPCRIVLDLEHNSSELLISRLRTLPEYQDVFISSQDAILMASGNPLLVVVDTNRPQQVESEALLTACNQVALIDHHRRAASYIQNAAISFHEPYASSACELVTELLQYMLEQPDILRYEAEALLSGIVLDTKNFTLRTGGRTFEAAAFLRRAGADTTEVKRLLQSDIKTAMAKYAIVQRAKIYKHGIAIAATDSAETRITAAQAADELLNISGIRASFVLYPEGEQINISARSIEDINVQVITEKLGGGGNKSTSGAQLVGVTMKEAVTSLLGAIDQYLEDEEF